MKSGLPFLQIFPEIVQKLDVAETFKRRKEEQSKSLTQANLDTKDTHVREFRETLFLFTKKKKNTIQALDPNQVKLKGKNS